MTLIIAIHVALYTYAGMRPANPMSAPVMIATLASLTAALVTIGAHTP